MQNSFRDGKLLGSIAGDMAGSWTAMVAWVVIGHHWRLEWWMDSTGNTGGYWTALRPWILATQERRHQRIEFA